MKCPICQTKLSASNTVWSIMCSDSVIAYIAYCCNNFSCPATSMGHRTQVDIHHDPPAQELVGYSFAFVDEKENTEALLLYGDKATNITGLKKIKSYWSNAAWSSGQQSQIAGGYNPSQYNGQMSFVANTAPLTIPPQSSGFQTTVITPHTLTAGNFVGNGGAVTLTGGVGAGCAAGGAVNITNGNNLSDEEDIIKSQFIDLSLHDFDVQVMSLLNRFKNLVIFS